MKKDVAIRERINQQNKFDAHLKWMVIVSGVEIAAHAVKETAEKHKTKILTPIAPAMYKGKKL